LLAPVLPLAQYVSMLPLQALAVPLMLTGVLGAAFTASVRAPLLPQPLLAVTLSVQTLKLPGQSMETLLKLFGPPMLPQVRVQL